MQHGGRTLPCPLRLAAALSHSPGWMGQATLPGTGSRSGALQIPFLPQAFPGSSWLSQPLAVPCASGLRGERVPECLTIPAQHYDPPSTLHFCALPNANIWSQSWQRRPQGPGTRRFSHLGIAMVNSVDTNTDPTARMKVSVSGGTSASRQPRREPSSTAAMPDREGALSGPGGGAMQGTTPHPLAGVFYACPELSGDSPSSPNL